METFGKKLTEARTIKGLDFDQVSRETNITRRYLEALEKEDFTVFPGEPYLLGFLRNYCEYLGLNSNEIIASYKNMKIQESAVPLKELMPKRPLSDRLLSGPNTGKILIAVGASVVVLLVVIIGMAIAGHVSKGGAKTEKVETTHAPVTYEVGNTEFSQRVYTGDILSVATPAGTFKLVVKATAPALKLDTPAGSRVVELGQDLLIDLTGDDKPDVKVFVADLFKNDPNKGADIRMTAGDAVASAAPLAGDSSAISSDVTVSSTTPSVSANKQTVLFEGGSAYPVTMNATFRGYCLFRYESDRSNREERYYQKSELLTVQANNGIRIWASNGNSVKIQMIAGGKTVDLEVSRPGEVLVRDLKWLKDEGSGRYKFVVMDID